MNRDTIRTAVIAIIAVAIARKVAPRAGLTGLI